MATTSDVKITPGVGNNVATWDITEDAETKKIQRVGISDSTGAEVSFATGTAGSPAGGVSTVQGQAGMTPVAITRSAISTGGATLSGTQSTASTNATSVKASAGTLCGGHAINTTGTIYYLRFYNLATAPTPSSATGYVLTVPVPANTTGAGVLLEFGPFGANFSTGIAFCITGGPSSTDNTNAAVGVFVNLAYN